MLMKLIHFDKPNKKQKKVEKPSMPEPHFLDLNQKQIQQLYT